MTPLADAEARRRIVDDLDATLIVEAAAGTGKTTALISRMISLLGSGRATLEQIVAVTFTEKAAGELKLRLRAALEQAHGEAEGEPRARYEAALAALEAARIGTIHSFCADLLRERPIEAGVDPELVILSEDQERALTERAFEGWFASCLEAPPEGVRRMLRSRGTPPKVALLRAAADLIGRRDHPAPWRRDPFERDAAIDEVLEAVRGVAALAELATAPDDYLQKDLSRFSRFVADVDAREEVAPRDYDLLEAELFDLRRGEGWRRIGFGTWYGAGLARADVASRRDALKAALDAFHERSSADLAACLRVDLLPVVDAFERIKERSGYLDFLDLLIRTRDLLRDDDGVRESMRRDVVAIFVDEFQDTDPLQAEILLTLACDGPIPADGMLSPTAPVPVAGKLFVVGDPKQSIYRFRRADVGLYERIKRRLTRAGVSLLTLTTSFRARPSIQRVINRAFEPHMQGSEDGSQASYVPLSEHRAENDSQPSVVALPVPRPYGRWGKVFRAQVERSLPDAVGAFVDWLLNESGWTVGDGSSRPIESRDVCLLFRSTTRFGQSVVAPYVLALEARSIPHVLLGGRASHDREELLALAAALRAIEHPDDPLSVYATLRGPFFSFSDEELLLHKVEVGPLHPLVPIEESLFDPSSTGVPDALNILRELHFARNRAPIADTLARFLDATRAHAGVANWPNGEQALANVLRTLSMARRVEAEGALSFRAFVERFADRMERGVGLDAPVLEERAAGVRVMTVHKAKGLEFPVVVLCDPTLPRTSDWPQRYIDAESKLFVAPLAGCVPVELSERRDEVLHADACEEIRLAYVAATRARELLVVPCLGDAPADGWVDPLHRALYPEEAARREAEPAPGCPTFGGQSVLERPDKVRHLAGRSVQPGLHHIDDASVVWWDPGALSLDREARGGLRRMGLLAPGAEQDEASAVQFEAHLAWVARRAEARASGATPSWRARSVTAIVHELEASEHRPNVERTSPPDPGRPSGARFGTLVHVVLGECSLGAGRDELERLARMLARTLEAPDDEVSAAVDVARAALAHPLFDRVRAADAVRREVPVTVPLEDGSSAEGVIDLAFREAGRWVVVDFKTDRERLDKPWYREQLSIYRRAVQAATGAPVDTVLFYL